MNCVSLVMVVMCIGSVYGQVYDNGADVLEGSMGGLDHHDDPGRQKRESSDSFRTTEDLLKYLFKEVNLLRSKVTLLEKDNALFQQTIALVTKITDKRISKYTCGCLREIMMDQAAAVPCHMTTVVAPTMPQSTPTIAATPTCETFASADPVQDSGEVKVEVKPLDPSVFAVSYYGTSFFRYIFESQSVETLIDRQNTYAVTFEPVNEMIIWASYEPSAIYASRVDDTNHTTIASDVLSYGLAVDPERGLLFATTVSPNRAVAVMSTDGTGYRIIAHVSKYGRPSRITLDKKNENAFVAFRGRIIKVSYDGSNVSVLLQGRYITSLTFDNDNAVLYYADRIVINKLKDTTGDNPKPTRVIRFKPKSGSYPSDLSVRGDKMYIGFKFKKIVQEMNLSTKKLTTLATVDGEFVSLCLAP